MSYDLWNSQAFEEAKKRLELEEQDKKKIVCDCNISSLLVVLRF